MSKYKVRACQLLNYYHKITAILDRPLGMTKNLKTGIVALRSIYIILSILESKIPRVFLSEEIISPPLSDEAYSSIFRESNKI